METGPALGLQTRFEAYRNEFFDKCHRIYEERRAVYGRKIDIRDYWPFGICSIFDPLWGKVLRIKSLLHNKPERITGEDLKVLEDSLIDLAVYTSFLFAENRCRLGEREDLQLRERIKEHEIRSRAIDVLDGRAPADDVGRMVVESEPEKVDHPFSPLHIGACPTCTKHAEGSRTDIGRCDVGMASREYPESLTRADG